MALAGNVPRLCCETGVHMKAAMVVFGFLFCLLNSTAASGAVDSQPAPDTRPAEVGQTAVTRGPTLLLIFHSGKRVPVISAKMVDGEYQVVLETGLPASFAADKVKAVRELTEAELRLRAKSEERRARRIAERAKNKRDDWLAKWYPYYKDKIVLFEGRAHDCLPARFAAERCPWDGLVTAVWRDGADGPRFRRITGAEARGMTGALQGAEILQVLDPSSLLVSVRGSTRYERRTYRLQGVKTQGFADGDRLSSTVVVVTGTYSYTAVTGGRSTVMSLKPVPVLTRAQFDAVCARGISLRYWHLDRWSVTCPECHGVGEFHHSYWYKPGPFEPLEYRHRSWPCSECNGLGYRNIKQWVRRTVKCPSALAERGDDHEFADRRAEWFDEMVRDAMSSGGASQSRAPAEGSTEARRPSTAEQDEHRQSPVVGARSSTAE